jgi:hypothetical protein
VRGIDRHRCAATGRDRPVGAAAAAEQRLPRATRDRRALDTCRALGVEVDLLA